MARRRTASRTVRFFEIVDHRSGEPLDGELPWHPALAALSHHDVSPDERSVEIGGEQHHGGPWFGSNLPDMLLFSRIREDAELPELFNRRSGDLTALEVAESEGVAETTHIGFFPSNVVGMVRTNTTPGAGSFERWINNMHLFDGLRPVTVQPLSRVDVTRRVEDVEQARGIRVRMRTTAAQQIADRSPRLAETVRHLHEQFGSVMVEMRIYIPQDQGYTEESDTIMAEARGLIDLTADGSVDGLQAAELQFRSRERARADDINMLKDKLSETVDVITTDEEGRSTNRESAARAMQAAYARLEGDLQAAVGRDRS